MTKVGATILALGRAFEASRVNQAFHQRTDWLVASRQKLAELGLGQRTIAIHQHPGKLVEAALAGQLGKPAQVFVAGCTEHRVSTRARAKHQAAVRQVVQHADTSSSPSRSKRPSTPLRLTSCSLRTNSSTACHSVRPGSVCASLSRRTLRM